MAKEKKAEKTNGHTVGGKASDDHFHDNPIKALGTKPGETKRAGGTSPKGADNDTRIGIQAPDAMRL